MLENSNRFLCLRGELKAFQSVAWVLLHVVANWAESDYGLSAGQHAVLPEGKVVAHGTCAM